MAMSRDLLGEHVETLMGILNKLGIKFDTNQQDTRVLINKLRLKFNTRNDRPVKKEGALIW
jgi:hypothetical protein